MQRATLDHIAQLAGVSKTTVSLILNNKAKQNRISNVTLQKVKDVIIENDFIINNQAKCFRMNKSLTIGVIVPDLDNPFFAKIISNLENVGKEKDYLFLVGTTDDNEKKEESVINRFLQHAVDGLIIVSANEVPQKLPPTYISTVYIDRKVKLDKAPSIVTNHKEAAKEVTTFLLKNQIEDVWFLNGDENVITSKERYKGFQEAFLNMNKKVNAKLVFNGKHNKESGYQLIKNAFANNSKQPQCIFTTSWSLMEGVLEYLKQNNLLTSNLTLSTFDHNPLLDYFPLKSVSIQQDTFSIASKAFHTLYAMMNNEPFALQQVISAQIITRNFNKQKG